MHCVHPPPSRAHGLPFARPPGSGASWGGVGGDGRWLPEPWALRATLRGGPRRRRRQVVLGGLAWAREGRGAPGDFVQSSGAGGKRAPSTGASAPLPSQGCCSAAGSSRGLGPGRGVEGQSGGGRHLRLARRRRAAGGEKRSGLWPCFPRGSREVWREWRAGALCRRGGPGGGEGSGAACVRPCGPSRGRSRGSGVSPRPASGGLFIRRGIRGASS